MKPVIDKFLKYVQIDTESDEYSESCPSTMKQHDLARLLVEELTSLKVEDIRYDKEHCYVYAHIPASKGYEKASTIGFIAHMDTSPAVSGTNVKPHIIEDYDGEDIVLNETGPIILRTSDFPEIKAYKGQSLIVTDGTTLLGADDKAGIAEIMAMTEYLMEHPELKHGRIMIGFTPDEEIGRGADYFDVKGFGADYAYTVDGSKLGELECENFNAASAKVVIKGRSVHPGDAKHKMINSILLAQEFQGLLPVFDNPMYTEKYEGFFHLDAIHGDVEETTMEYIIRDHDRLKFEAKKETMLANAAYMNQKYGEDTVVAIIKDSYYNMLEVIRPHMHLIDNACDVMKELGIVPVISPIRGGTDGARLSFEGLPCPNLCTGGHNYHGRYEYASVESMEKVVELLIGIAKKYGEWKK